MPTNDQLTRAERIRLEALSQSSQITMICSTTRPTVQDVLNNAETIETWLRQAREDA